MKIDGFVVEPLTRERWPDLEIVMGRGGMGGCWCMYWIHPTSKSWGDGAKGGSRARNKRAFRRIVAEGPPPGLLAYDGDVAAGWCRVMPRSRMPGIDRSRYFKTDLDVNRVWSLSCFVVRRSHRGRGLTRILTMAAIRLARTQRAKIVEVYPSETKIERSAASIYTGVASTFRRLGFKVVQRTAPHRPMMRLDVP